MDARPSLCPVAARGGASPPQQRLESVGLRPRRPPIVRPSLLPLPGLAWMLVLVAVRAVAVVDMCVTSGPYSGTDTYTAVGCTVLDAPVVINTMAGSVFAFDGATVPGGIRVTGALNGVMITMTNSHLANSGGHGLFFDNAGAITASSVSFVSTNVTTSTSTAAEADSIRFTATMLVASNLTVTNATLSSTGTAGTATLQNINFFSGSHVADGSVVAVQNASFSVVSVGGAVRTYEMYLSALRNRSVVRFTDVVAVATGLDVRTCMFMNGAAIDNSTLQFTNVTASAIARLGGTAAYSFLFREYSPISAGSRIWIRGGNFTATSRSDACFSVNFFDNSGVHSESRVAVSSSRFYCKSEISWARTLEFANSRVSNHGAIEYTNVTAIAIAATNSYSFFFIAQSSITSGSALQIVGGSFQASSQSSVCFSINFYDRSSVLGSSITIADAYFYAESDAADSRTLEFAVASPVGNASIVELANVTGIAIATAASSYSIYFVEQSPVLAGSVVRISGGNFSAASQSDALSVGFHDRSGIHDGSNISVSSAHLFAESGQASARTLVVRSNSPVFNHSMIDFSSVVAIAAGLSAETVAVYTASPIDDHSALKFTDVSGTSTATTGESCSFGFSDNSGFATESSLAVVGGSYVATSQQGDVWFLDVSVLSAVQANSIVSLSQVRIVAASSTGNARALEFRSSSPITASSVSVTSVLINATGADSSAFVLHSLSPITAQSTVTVTNVTAVSTSTAVRGDSLLFNDGSPIDLGSAVRVVDSSLTSVSRDGPATSIALSVNSGVRRGSVLSVSNSTLHAESTAAAAHTFDFVQNSSVASSSTVSFTDVTSVAKGVYARTCVLREWSPVSDNSSIVFTNVTANSSAGVSTSHSLLFEDHSGVSMGSAMRIVGGNFTATSEGLHAWSLASTGSSNVCDDSNITVTDATMYVESKASLVRTVELSGCQIANGSAMTFTNVVATAIGREARTCMLYSGSSIANHSSLILANVTAKSIATLHSSIAVWFDANSPVEGNSRVLVTRGSYTVTAVGDSGIGLGFNNASHIRGSAVVVSNATFHVQSSNYPVYLVRVGVGSDVTNGAELNFSSTTALLTTSESCHTDSASVFAFESLVNTSTVTVDGGRYDVNTSSGVPVSFGRLAPLHVGPTVSVRAIGGVALQLTNRQLNSSAAVFVMRTAGARPLPAHLELGAGVVARGTSIALLGLDTTPTAVPGPLPAPTPANVSVHGVVIANDGYESARATAALVRMWNTTTVDGAVRLAAVDFPSVAVGAAPAARVSLRLKSIVIDKIPATTPSVPTGTLAALFPAEHSCTVVGCNRWNGSVSGFVPWATSAALCPTVASGGTVDSSPPRVACESASASRSSSASAATVSFSTSASASASTSAATQSATGRSVSHSPSSSASAASASFSVSASASATALATPSAGSVSGSLVPTGTKSGKTRSTTQTGSPTATSTPSPTRATFTSSSTWSCTVSVTATASIATPTKSAPITVTHSGVTPTLSNGPTATVSLSVTFSHPPTVSFTVQLPDPVPVPVAVRVARDIAAVADASSEVTTTTAAGTTGSAAVATHMSRLTSLRESLSCKPEEPDPEPSTGTGGGATTAPVTPRRKTKNTVGDPLPVAEHPLQFAIPAAGPGGQYRAGAIVGAAILLGMAAVLVCLVAAPIRWQVSLYRAKQKSMRAAEAALARDSNDDDDSDSGDSNCTQEDQTAARLSRKTYKRALAWCRFPGCLIVVLTLVAPRITSSATAMFLNPDVTQAGYIITICGCALVGLLVGALIVGHRYLFRRLFIAVPQEAAAEAAAAAQLRADGGAADTAANEAAPAADPEAANADDSGALTVELVSPLSVKRPRAATMAAAMHINDAAIRSREKLAKMVEKGEFVWAARDPSQTDDLMRAYGFYFDVYGPRAPWFLIFELVSAIAAGVVSHLQETLGCTWAAWLTMIVNIIYAAVIVFVRPHRLPLDRLFYCGLGVFQALCAVAVFAVQSLDEGSEQRNEAEASASLLLSISAVSMVGLAGYEAFKVVYMQLVIRWRKLDAKAAAALRRRLQREERERGDTVAQRRGEGAALDQLDALLEDDAFSSRPKVAAAAAAATGGADVELDSLFDDEEEGGAAAHAGPLPFDPASAAAAATTLDAFLLTLGDDNVGEHRKRLLDSSDEEDAEDEETKGARMRAKIAARLTS